VSAEAAVAAAAVPDAPGAPAPLPPVKHVLSRELQLYFERVAAVLRGAGDAPAQRGEGGGGGAGSGAAALQVQRAVLASLASDPGALRRRATRAQLRSCPCSACADARRALQCAAAPSGVHFSGAVPAWSATRHSSRCGAASWRQAERRSARSGPRY